VLCYADGADNTLNIFKNSVKCQRKSCYGKLYNFTFGAKPVSGRVAGDLACLLNL